jgi:hypothetical protein
VIQIDTTTALETGLVLPTPDRVARLVTDPRTEGLFYLAENCVTVGTDQCDVGALDTRSGITTPFITLTGHAFYRGFAFDPDGAELFVLVDRPSPSLLVLGRSGPEGLVGSLERTITLHERPNDIAFLGPDLAIITHTFSDVSAFVPGPDRFAVFAAGGFTGATKIASRDGCVFVPQDGTRFDDDTIVNVSEGAVELASIVRICPRSRPHKRHHASVGRP